MGRRIDVGDVLSKSTNLLSQKPVLLIPQVIVLVLSLIGDVANVATLSLAEVAILFITAVVSIIVTGAYPSLVQAALGGGQISVGHALRQAAGRFWTLLLAGILVGLIVVLGTIAFIVPGIIFATWYAYAVPAIMLENKGALDGMSASRAFGHDKKWSTFSIFLVVFVVAIVIGIIEVAVTLGSPLAGRVVQSLLSVPLEAWIAVIITYTYITYGPSAVTASPAVSQFGGVSPSPMPQPSTPFGPSPPRRFCRYCGSPVEPDSKFCSSCGAAL